MNSFKYMPIFILLFFSLKYLLKFLEKKLSSLKIRLETYKIENGMLSINDLQNSNYTRFINTINLYLSTHGYDSINIFANGNFELTNIQATLSKEKVLISCIQNSKLDEDKDNSDNWQATTKIEVQCLIARMHEYGCKKGLLIINSIFSKDAIDFVDIYNNKNLNSEIKLVDGYELTRATRNYKNYILKEA